MPGRSNSRQETYLPTGWRVTGAAADRIAERAAAYAEDHLVPGDVADTLFAVQFTLPPVVAGRPSVERLLDAITDDIRRTWAECPRLGRDAGLERAPSRFGGLQYEVEGVPGKEWLGDVVWRSVHPVVAGAPITTRVLLEERRSYTRGGIRVTADDGPASVRGFVGAGQAQPAFLRSLRGEVTPVWQGAPLGAHSVGNGQVADLVHSVLPGATRSVPVVILAPLEEGGYIVDPDDLAWELLGRAVLYVLQEHRHTFELTDTLGDRRMSCYWGAARAYMPGWSRHDDPYDHPLLVGDRLGDPVIRAAWLGELGIWTGTRLELPPTPAERRAQAADAPVPADAANAPAAPAEERGPGDVPRSGTPRAEQTPGMQPPAAEASGASASVSPASAPVPDLRPLLEALIADVRSLGLAVGTDRRGGATPHHRGGPVVVHERDRAPARPPRGDPRAGLP
jgi:hypothetical protein